MMKSMKYLLVSGMVAAMAFAAGCGDEKKPEPTKKPAATTTTQKPAAQKPAAPAEKLAEGPNWRYPSYIKSQADTPKVTPEIQKIVDECYAQMKLHPSEKGKLLNDSKINASDQRKVRDLWFHAKGANYDNKNKFKNSKGKEVYTQEAFHIRFTVDKDTSAIKNWQFDKYVQNTEFPDGKTIVIKKG